MKYMTTFCAILVLVVGSPPEGVVKRVISPLLPTRSQDPVEVPFSNCRQMMQYNAERNLSALGGLAITPTAMEIERNLESQKSKGRC